MRKPKIRELGEAVRALLKGPYTSDFPATAVELPVNFRGKPEFHDADCIGCGACAEVCPTDALNKEEIIETDSGIRRVYYQIATCIFCGQCEFYCPTEKGIQLSKRFDLATFDLHEHDDEVRKRLLLCEVCKAVIGAVEHIKWTARKIGPSAFANPTLMLTMLDEKRLPGHPQAPDSPYRRGDRVRILCPKCRRESVLELD